MKRPLQLSLAIALALGGTNALALGLGPVHVKSKLNQPLDAEIPVIQGSPGEAEGLLVNLAAAEDFERVGISRSHLSVPLEFTLGKGSNGETVIKVTSKDPIHDTYLDFLLEANWPKGRLLREYTVLLDPPVMAPARGAATTSAVAAAQVPVTVKRREAPATASTEAPKPKPALAPPRPKPAPAAAPAPSVRMPEHKEVAGQYGPVAAGETLSGVARATRVSGVNADQMMLALLKSNPNAFYKDNVNALKRGAILRVPSADEVKAIGSATEAAAEVRSQIEDWRGARATPTRVADAASTTPVVPVAATTPKVPKATATSGKAGADEHLALVPPKAGRDSMAMADRPGSGAGSAATSELKSELARTRETLTTREQEAGDLKSRVKELEGLKDKNDRLIGLKDSEIAELQQKLKQLQEKSPASTAKPASTTSSTPAATAPASTTPATAATATSSKVTPPPAPPPAAPSTTATAKIDKQDIWGDSGTTPSTAKADAGKTPPPVTTSTSTPMAGEIAPPPSSPSAMTPSATTSIPPSAASTQSTPPLASSTTPVSTTTPLDATPATTSPSATSTAMPVTTTAAPRPTPKGSPARASTSEWYEASWVKPAALGAGVLLLLGGLLGMRKRKGIPVASNGRGSVADSFGDSPLTGSGGASPGTIEGEEESLREQLQLDPSNTGLHLELLSLYYAERDVARFEDAAADMHAYVEDAHQPEWLEAQAMGQELAPHNPLFSGVAHFDDSDAAIASAQADTIERPHLRDHDDFDTAPSRLSPAVEHPHDEDRGFDLGHDEFVAAPVPPAQPTARHDEGFDFTLPPLDMDPPSAHVPPTVVAAPQMAELDDDYFAGDDAISTKLDLAKAYMDMGDPEGARSMLEEVVAEGSEAQKAEAHRLIAEIR